MNTLELKRKAQGFHLRNEDGDGGAGGSMSSASDSFGGFSSDPGDSAADADAAAGLNPNQAQTDTTVSREAMGGVLSDISRNSDKSAAAQPDGMSIPGYSVNGISLATQRELQDAGFGGLSAGPTQTIDQSLNANTVGNVLDVLGQMAISAIPGMGLVKTGIALSQGMSLKDAVAQALTGVAAGKINGAIGKAIGPEAARALSTYNAAAPLGRALGFNTPSLNPGGAIASAVTGAKGQTLAQSGPTNLDGTADVFGGFSSGGGRDAPLLQDAPAPAAPVNKDPMSAPPSNVVDALTSGALNFNATAFGKAIRQGAKNRWETNYGSRY